MTTSSPTPQHKQSLQIERARARYVGARFFRWTVIEYYPRNKPKRIPPRCLCRCECGTERVVNKCNLISGISKSCGCFNDERIRTHNETINGKESTEYRAWAHMKYRCRNPNFKQWKDYGGRGITYCERWERFENFLADMGRKPSPELTLERINNEGNYEPGNCCWATRLEQRHNRRDSQR